MQASPYPPKYPQASLCRALLVFALACAGEAHAAPWYHVTPIGGSETTARGMNSLGDVVGNYGGVAFVYAEGALKVYALPGSFATSFIGINDHGMVSGTAGLPTRYGAFRFDSGNFTMLNVPADDFDSVGFAINNAGIVAGTYTNNAQRPFTAAGADVTTLWTHEIGGTAIDINNAGTVAGSVFRNGEQVAVIDRNGVLTDIGSFGGSAQASAVSSNDLVTGSYTAGPYHYRGFYYDGQATQVIDDPLRHVMPLDINAAGWIVGREWNLNDDRISAWDAFLYVNGERIPLDTRLDTHDWHIREAVALNDQGQIAANACYLPTGVCQAVRLDISPVPEPGSWAMLLAGLGLLLPKLYRLRDA